MHAVSKSGGIVKGRGTQISVPDLTPIIKGEPPEPKPRDCYSVSDSWEQCNDKDCYVKCYPSYAHNNLTTMCQKLIPDLPPYCVCFYDCKLFYK